MNFAFSLEVNQQGQSKQTIPLVVVITYIITTPVIRFDSQFRTFEEVLCGRV